MQESCETRTSAAYLGCSGLCLARAELSLLDRTVDIVSEIKYCDLPHLCAWATVAQARAMSSPAIQYIPTYEGVLNWCVGRKDL